MKQTIWLTGMLLMMFILFVSLQPAQNDEIYGTWEIASGSHNSSNAPQYMTNRLQSFNRDKTFESAIIFSEEKKIRANWGIFYLINDSTIITYHKSQAGIIDHVANTYTFKIRNDSLHLYGYFLRPVSASPPALVKLHIDEWWVRTEKQ